MPVDWSKYPDSWKSEIRPRILKRAGNKCEDCGAKNYKPHPETGSLVVLTIAHLDHDTEHNDDDNLRAWCQRCHLRYDRELHINNAKVTRKKRKASNAVQ